MPHFFISYAKKDTPDLAIALADALGSSSHITTWVDRNLKVVDSAWSQQIEREIQRCDFMIVLLSPDVDRPIDPSKKQDESYVRTEIRYMAVECGKKERIIPVIAKASPRPIAIELAGKQRIDFTNRNAQNLNDLSWLVEHICTEAGIQTPEMYRSIQARLRAEEQTRQQAEQQAQIQESLRRQAEADKARKAAAQQPARAHPRAVQTEYADAPAARRFGLHPVLRAGVIGVVMMALVGGIAAKAATSWLYPYPACATLKTGSSASNGTLSDVQKVLNTGQIAFVSDRDSHRYIYTMNADGSNQRRLSGTEQVDNTFPAWSPDGTQVAFNALHNGKYGIDVMNADGSNTRALTDDSEKQYYLNWSPDGTRIVFAKYQNKTYQIYTISPDGTNLVQLTRSTLPSNYPRGRRMENKLLML